MDPKETLRLCDQAISDCDADSARILLSIYREWRTKGGFEPLEIAGSGMHGDKFSAYCATRLESLEAQL